MVRWPVCRALAAMVLLALKLKQMKSMRMEIKWRNGNVNVLPVTWDPLVKYRSARIIHVNMAAPVCNFLEAVIYVYVHWENMAIIVNTVSSLYTSNSTDGDAN